ncbi:hypothetical protein I3I95_11925 [bacterium]|nr:hypothetical protein [bacterium]
MGNAKLDRASTEQMAVPPAGAYDKGASAGDAGLDGLAGAADLDDFSQDAFDPLADEGFDPDEDVDFPVADGSNLQLAETKSRLSAQAAAECPENNDRPAAERIQELFREMGKRRRTLLGILDYCRTMRPVLEVADHITELKKYDRSVYSPTDFCSLLQRAGAIERVDADGNHYVEESLEPEVVMVDGVQYLEPRTPAPAYWRTTEDGIAALDADDPVAATRALFEEDGSYLPIYRRVLTMCARPGGATARDLSRAIDGDPLVQSPRLYSSHFVEKLNVSEALAWGDRVWVITDAGREALEALADVDDPASDEIAAGIMAGEE